MKSLRAVSAIHRVSLPRLNPHLDFLAPSIPISARTFWTASSTPPENEKQPAQDPSVSNPQIKKKTYTLTAEQKEFLSRALRVNQAGELAATLIYASQTPQIVPRHPHLLPLMKHMYAQEAGHLSTFNALIQKHRVRPTAMYPVWSAAASFLGWSTGRMGREAAMACTEAVETEIGSHYNEQVREILKWVAEAEARGEELDEEVRGMVDTFRRIRDEELEHLDHAVENDAKEARPYEPLVNVIRLGCRAAIGISERV